MTEIIQFYLLRSFTNLHVGSGETNYGVIDKLIERDATTGFPCINSTGLKGAIKQKFAGLDQKLLKVTFGSDIFRNTLSKEEQEGEAKNKGKSEDKTQQGSCQFLSARLLAMPVRSDIVPFFIATSPSLIEDFLQYWEDLKGIPHPSKTELEKVKNYTLKATAYDTADLTQSDKKVAGIIPENDSIVGKLKDLLQTRHPIVILPNELMIELADDLNLPVIARNSLEDGQSNNLWYEQVLPRESLMYFPIIWDEDRSSDFNLTIGALQVGGNASVGYGFTKISLMS